MTHLEPTPGLNKTGVQMSPILTKEMLRGVESLMLSEQNNSYEGFDALRTASIQTAEPIGSIPLPLTLKGVFKTGIESVTGKNASLYIDKMGDRLSFERAGVRLYDAILRKCRNPPTDVPKEVVERLEEIRDQELKHMLLLKKSIEEIGADPTAMTPSADVSGVINMGLVQTLNDPRTSMAHCLGALLFLELSDNESWDALIELTESMGDMDSSQLYRAIKLEEDKHLIDIRRFHRAATQNEMGVQAALTH